MAKSTTKSKRARKSSKTSASEQDRIAEVCRANGITPQQRVYLRGMVALNATAQPRAVERHEVWSLRSGSLSPLAALVKAGHIDRGWYEHVDGSEHVYLFLTASGRKLASAVK